jgi:hypothetical protein
LFSQFEVGVIWSGDFDVELSPPDLIERIFIIWRNPYVMERFASNPDVVDVKAGRFKKGGKGRLSFQTIREIV